MPIYFKPDTVTDSQPLHGVREVGVGQLHYQVIVIGHEHIGVQVQPESSDGFAEQFAKVLSIRVIEIDGFAFIAPGGEVIPGAGPFDA